MKYNHYIIDIEFTDKKMLIDVENFKETLLSFCKESGVTVLHNYFHSFKETDGYTGVICLSESHISVHTWPEHLKMCLDVFMCNNHRSDIFMKLLKNKIDREKAKYDIRIIERM